MLMTSIGYDYYKGFVTAFIEINGVSLTIFGNPPMKIIRPYVNVNAVLESIAFFVFEILLIIHLSVGKAFSLFIVFVPLYAFLLYQFIVMTVVYILFVFCMFRYAKSIPWIIVFIITLPIGYINLLLFFFLPLLFCVLLPIQNATTLWHSPTTWDSTVYLLLAMVGCLLKGFIRPTDDEQNPFSKQHPPLYQSIAYFLWVCLTFLWIMLFTFAMDRRLPYPILAPFGGTNLSFFVTWIPALVAQLICIILFTVKAILVLKTLLKHKDLSNGDYILKVVTNVVIVIYICLFMVAQIITLVRLDQERQSQSGTSRIPAGAALVPLPIGQFLIIIVNLLPFIPIFQRKTDAEKEEREILTYL